MSTNNKDNVIQFRKPAAKPARYARKGVSPRFNIATPQFPHHDKVVRLTLRGLVRDDAFIRWLVESAVALQLDGWAKNTAGGDMDVLLAGNAGDVRQMMDFLKEGPRPVDMLLVEERVLQGDEPLWSGFHHLSPSDV